MASKRFDEFIKNASPELKAEIGGTGNDLSSRNGLTVPNPNEYSVTGPGRTGEISRPFASPPEAPLKVSENEPKSERRIDKAMNEQSRAQAVDRGTEAVKAGASVEPQKAPPVKEPER